MSDPIQTETPTQSFKKVEEKLVMKTQEWIARAVIGTVCFVIIANCAVDASYGRHFDIDNNFILLAFTVMGHFFADKMSKNNQPLPPK